MARLLVPTGEGKRRHDEMSHERHRQVERLLSGWSEEDLRSFSELLSRFNEERASLSPRGEAE